jgi:beta-lactam-binding protein with PASTA domain
MASRRDRVRAAGDSVAALPPDQLTPWPNWIDRWRGRRGREARIDEMAWRRRPPAATTEEEVVEEPAGPPPTERYWWLWLLLLLLLVVGGLIAWWLLTRGNDKSTVPNVIGLRSQAAVSRIHDRDLKALPRVGQSNRPPNVVFAQKPGAGTQLDEGQTVTISISSGRLVVPDVTGLPLADAKQSLRRAHFSFTVKRVASSRPKGIVVEQSPVAGVTAVGGTAVKLNVSSGAKPVVVPRVVGQTQGAAVTTLTRVGLKPVLQNVPSSKAAGIVVGQKPAAGKEVDKGSKVTVNVSSGTGGTTTVQTTTLSTTTTTPGTTTTAAARVPVPRVRALAVTTGLRRLNALQFRPVVRYAGSSLPAGQIISQSPTSGTTASRRSRVRITVSNGPNPNTAASVPSVVGQQQADAVSTLRQAGFRVLTLYRQTSDPLKNGIVLEQQPVAGSSIPRGSWVAIFVGRSA